MATGISTGESPARERALPLSRSLEEDAEALSQALSEMVHVIRFCDRDRACCHDISVSQCHALKSVADGGPLTVNELAAELYLDKSTASRIANGLVGRGLLERGRDPEDGRVVRLSLTAEGRALHRTIDDELRNERAELLADFDPEVRADMVTLLKRLSRSFARRVQAEGGSCCTVSPE